MASRMSGIKPTKVPISETQSEQSPDGKKPIAENTSAMATTPKESPTQMTYKKIKGRWYHVRRGVQTHTSFEESEGELVDEAK